jgi:hypothetical protein
MSAHSKKKIVHFVAPFEMGDDGRFGFLNNSIADIVNSDDRLRHPDPIEVGKPIIDQLYDALEHADLVICDITGTNPNIMYNLGYAHGFKKPVILISDKPELVPFDVRSVKTIFYDNKSTERSSFTKLLRLTILDAIENPDQYNIRPSVLKSISTVFISYNHKDVQFLDRLLVHLKPLEKQRLINSWSDQKILAGEKWKLQIQDALSRSRAAILLISADFLASDFIVDNELPPLLKKAETGGTAIIPVIIKPCRFARDENLKDFHSINNPDMPLISLDEAGRENIWDKVASRIEDLFRVK